MSDEYQLRKDIDQLIDDVYDVKDGSVDLVGYNEDSSLKQLYETDEYNQPINQGTIDTILKFYRLLDIADRVDELEDRLNDTE